MNYDAAKTFILNKLENELSDKLYYHGLHHTLDVLQVTEELCQLENIAKYETILLKTAALFHDSGFTVQAQDHEKIGCDIAREHLPRYAYTDVAIEKICGMIMSTKIPQTPKTYLETILADADLDYLGRTDFYTIGESLFKELKAFGIVQEEEAWNRIQVKFLEAHHFWTKTNLDRREKQKSQYLIDLKKLVASYEPI